MPRQCAVIGCKTKARDGSGKSLFSFVNDLQQREKWLNAVGTEEKDLAESACICELHFAPDQFIIIGLQPKRLKSDAIPNFHLPRNTVLSNSPLLSSVNNTERTYNTFWFFPGTGCSSGSECLPRKSVHVFRWPDSWSRKRRERFWFKRNIWENCSRFAMCVVQRPLNLFS